MLYIKDYVLVETKVTICVYLRFSSGFDPQMDADEIS